MNKRAYLLLAVVVLAIAVAAWLQRSDRPEGELRSPADEVTGSPAASKSTAQPSAPAATAATANATKTATATVDASRPLRLASASELNKLIATRGIDDPDTRYAIFAALDLCNDARLIRPGALTPARMVEELRRIGKASEAEQADAFLARLCDQQLDIPEELALLLSEDAQLAMLEPEHELVDAAALDYHGTPERFDDDQILLQKLGRVIKTTENLTSFVEALSLASQKQVLVELIGLQGTPLQYHSPEVLHVASYLAGCEIFRDCGPASLLASRMCFTVCAQAMSVQELLRQHSSEIQYREALALAQRIRAFRIS